MLTSHSHAWRRGAKVVAVLRTPTICIEPRELAQEDLGLPEPSVVPVVESTDDEPSPIPVVRVVTDREMMSYDESDSWIGQTVGFMRLSRS